MAKITAIISAIALPIPVMGLIYHIAPTAIIIGIAMNITNAHIIPNTHPIFADVVGYLFSNLLLMLSPPYRFLPDN